MKTIAQDQKRTESLLQRRGIRLHDIQSFSFMKRFHEVPRKSNLKVKDKYGAGILTLRLKQGIQRAFYVHPFQKPSSVIRYLISQDIPFENHITRKRTVAEIPTTTYQRPSLYMFYFFVLFITFMILGYQAVVFGSWWAYILGIISFGLSIYFIHMLMTRFCYLKVDNESLNEAFKNQDYKVNEAIVIYSIVDSLSELSTISKVQISVNGDTSGVYRDNFPLADMYDRNMDYVTGAESAFSETEEPTETD